jgi:pimeloyl-ACP methyl ester carboxylesterase
MPVIEHDGLSVEYLEEGAGAPVILIPSGISGNRQWMRLIADLKPNFRVIAPNLAGYGSTTPWRGPAPQTLADQVRPVQLLAKDLNGPLRIVGHSVGGTIAMKIAAMWPGQVSHLVLYEPNMFYLLGRHGRKESFAAVCGLRDDVKKYGTQGRWDKVAERHADFWNGPGTWAAMPEDRRAKFAQAVQPNFHEWEPVMDETTPLEGWSILPRKTLVVSARDTIRPMSDIVDLLSTAFPHWQSVVIPEGGHMAPLTRPDLVNPIVSDFLSS